LARQIRAETHRQTSGIGTENECGPWSDVAVLRACRRLGIGAC
jgi:hypothetical protein